MRVSLVVTFSGQDRPGLVSLLADAVAQQAGNWEESRMARLAGRFAGILKVSVEEDRVEALSTALRALAPAQLDVGVQRGEPLGEPPPDHRTLHLELTGADHEGIVRDVSAVLSRYGLNIEELATEYTTASMTGAPLFNATAELRCPPQTDLDALRASLEQIADDLVVDITLTALEA